MDTFGKRLKVLRKNKNMTQEELANALNISFQAISKWENEISNPDLSLIVPLAAVLGVSTDQLLGAVKNERDQELNTRFLDSQDYQEAIAVAKEAVKEQPYSYGWLFRLAYSEFCLFQQLPEGAEKDLCARNAEDHLRMLIERKKDDHFSAHNTLVHLLSLQGRNSEAESIARKIPDTIRRDQSLKYCLVGEEKQKHHRMLVNKAISTLLAELISYGTDESISFALDYINFLYPQPCEHYYQALQKVYIGMADQLVSQKRYADVANCFDKVLSLGVKEYEYFSSRPKNQTYYPAKHFPDCDIDRKAYIEYFGIAPENLIGRLDTLKYDEFRKTEEYNALVQKYRKIIEELKSKYGEDV